MARNWTVKLMLAVQPWRGQYTVYKATRKPLPDKTPRLVYSYFFYLHKICYGLGSTGYFMIMADFFGVKQHHTKARPSFDFYPSSPAWDIVSQHILMPQFD